jgi:DNA helicase HerA-like ATPase
MTKLRISRDLALPIEAVTDTFAFLAKRGAGKTYSASVLAEEMLKAKEQIVVLDPTGAWWGLRSSADGKGEGFPVTILGGEKGDVPLEETAGRLIADLAVDQPGSRASARRSSRSARRCSTKTS